MVEYGTTIFDRAENEISPMPDPPRETEYLWIWFMQLSDLRAPGFSMPGSLSHIEIKAWAELMDIALYPSEVDALRRLDRAYRNSTAKKLGLVKDDPVPVSQSLGDVAEMARLVREKEKRG